MAFLAMLRCLSLILLATAAASAATPEDQARAVLDQWKGACEAKDVDTASRLLAKDCVVISPGVLYLGRNRRPFVLHHYPRCLDRGVREHARSSGTVKQFS
jgi:hypothetical protein